MADINLQSLLNAAPTGGGSTLVPTSQPQPQQAPATPPKGLAPGLKLGPMEYHPAVGLHHKIMRK